MTTSATQTTGDSVSEKAQEVVAQVQDKAQEQARNLQQQASDRVRSEVDTRSTQAGEQLGSIVEALRKGAEHLQGQGNETGAKTAHQVADQTQRLAGYLTRSDSNRLLGDVEGFARRRPWLAGGIGMAAGFVASRFLKASSERRYGAAGPSSARHPDLGQGSR